MSDEIRYCTNGHALTPDNTITQGKYVRCRQCKRDTQRRRYTQLAGASTTPINNETVTPTQAANNFRSARYDGRRKLYVVGTYVEATRWLYDNHSGGAVIIENHRQLRGLQAKDVHFVLLPSYPKLPDFWLVQAQLRLLERTGATVEVK